MIGPEMLDLLWSTPVGTALAFRMVGLALLIFGLFMGRFRIWLSTLGGILAIWSFDHVGHVSTRGTTLLEITLTAHLVAIALWIGILTPLKRLASNGATYPAAALVGHKFGQTLIIIVIRVAALLALAAANKLRFIPKLRDADPKSSRPFGKVHFHRMGHDPFDLRGHRRPDNQSYFTNIRSHIN